jgi:hypothetical protein
MKPQHVNKTVSRYFNKAPSPTKKRILQQYELFHLKSPAFFQFETTSTPPFFFFPAGISILTKY